MESDVLCEWELTSSQIMAKIYRMQISDCD